MKNINSLKITGPVNQQQRRKNSHFFDIDHKAKAHYQMQPDDSAAQCYEIVRTDNIPIGFIWIACSLDEDIPENFNVHVEYVFVIPAERGGMVKWLVEVVLSKLQKSIDGLDKKSPISTVNSTSQPVTLAGRKFVLNLNHALKIFSENNRLDLICDEAYMP